MTTTNSPLVVAYGMGVDSTAMLVGLHQRGVRPDLILFADVGSEKPETYAYLPTIQAWCRSVGFPEIVVVKNPTCHGEHGDYSTIYENCIVNETLPSLAFGYKGCSSKWKITPQNAYCNTWAPAVECWAKGGKVTKYIGYDNGAKDSKRCVDFAEDKQYVYEYPLRVWGWDREECQRQILAAGLPLPVKSACFFCPSTQPAELRAMVTEHPELCDQIITMESLARNTKLHRPLEIQGLWGNGVKGFRGATPKPGSMTEYIQAVRETGEWVAPALVRAPRAPKAPKVAQDEPKAEPQAVVAPAAPVAPAASQGAVVTCPKCKTEHPAEAVAQAFGFRTVGGKQVRQSYCRPCRSGK